MALSYESKEAILKNYLEILQEAQGIIVTEYRGMGMKNLNAVRNVLRATKGRYVVTKNTLFLIALRQTGFAAPADLMAGPTAVAIAMEDIATMTKALMQRAKEDELLQLKGAILGKAVYGKEQLEAISTMPSMAEARSQLLGVLKAPFGKLAGIFPQPATKVVGILAEPGKQVVGVFNAYGHKDQTGAA